MSHRQFTDSIGSTWDVWDVHPTTASQALAQLCWQPAGAAPDAGRTPVAPALAGGWLCFEHGGERRRLAPIPEGWNDLQPPELERLRDTAARVRTSDERQREVDGERRRSA